MSTKVEKSIKKCQEEVKIELIEETLTLYNEYRQNLEAQLHAQAHVVHQTNEQHELPLQDFGTHQTVQDHFTHQDPASFHPDFYTTQGFEDDDSYVEESRKQLTSSKMTTTPHMRAVTRKRRDASSEWYHPTLISHEDKWIAGVRIVSSFSTQTLFYVSLQL